jgi:hypothetical protein
MSTIALITLLRLYNGETIKVGEWIPIQLDESIRFLEANKLINADLTITDKAKRYIREIKQIKTF